MAKRFVEFLASNSKESTEFVTTSIEEIKRAADRFYNPLQRKDYGIALPSLDVLAKSYLKLAEEAEWARSKNPDEKDEDKKISHLTEEKTNQFMFSILKIACSELLDEKGNLHPIILKKLNLKEEDKNLIIKGFAHFILMMIIPSIAPNLLQIKKSPLLKNRIFDTCTTYLANVHNPKLIALLGPKSKLLDYAFNEIKLFPNNTSSLSHYTELLAIYLLDHLASLLKAALPETVSYDALIVDMKHKLEADNFDPNTLQQKLKTLKKVGEVISEPRGVKQFKSVHPAAQGITKTIELLNEAVTLAIRVHPPNKKLVLNLTQSLS